MAEIGTILPTDWEAPQRGVDSQSVFRIKANNAWVKLRNDIIPKVNQWSTEANLLRDDVNNLQLNAGIKADLATTQAEIATTKASEATQKASEASSSANQALTYKNQIQGYVIPAGTSYNIDQINTQNSAMTKAQFNALAEERKANRAGSGFDSLGWGSIAIPSTDTIINEGMWVRSTIPNVIHLSRSVNPNTGVSKSKIPIVNINGVQHKIFDNGGDKTTLPPAPNIYPYDTVLTTEQIASGVIKHADSSNSGLVTMGKNLSGTTFNQTITVVNGKKYIIEYVDNTIRKTLEITASSTSYIINLSGTNITEVAAYPADAISRSDLVFLESWHEDISEKNIVYPLGNVQYLGGNTDGLTGIVNGSFTGFETYSLFGNWQTPSALVGKGYVWSSLTEAQKKAFISNADNNCYLDGDKVIQVRHRIRVVQGWGDSWINTNETWYDSSIKFHYGALAYELETARVKPKGKSVILAKDLDAPATSYYNVSVSTDKMLGHFISINTTVAYDGKCFALPINLVQRKNQGMWHYTYNPNGTKLASDGLDAYRTSISFTSISDCFNPAKLLTASGYIGSVSGRPDGLFYDRIHEGDVLDLRNSSKKSADKSRLISREFNKLVAGTYRGKEGEWSIKTITKTISYGNFIGGLNTKAYYISHIASDIGLDLNDKNILNGGIYIIVNTGADAGKVIMARNYFFESGAGYLAIGDGGIPSTLIRYTDGSIPSALSGQSITVYAGVKSTRTKSNTLLHCNIIGNPANYPTAWKQSGVFGTPLIVAEDGTSLLPDGIKDTFKLSRKANATPLLCLRSTDNGVTWTSFTPTFNTITNEITLTDEPAANLVVVYYQTHTSMAVPVVKGEVIEIGNVFSGNHYEPQNGAYLFDTLLNKVLIGYGKSQGYPLENYELAGNTFWSNPARYPIHKVLTFNLFGVLTALKVFPYLTSLNGKAYLNLVFKEIKNNGTSFGDDNKFNIVDNVSTTTDNNAATVLIGTKQVELPYFIDAGE